MWRPLQITEQNIKVRIWNAVLSGNHFPPPFLPLFFSTVSCCMTSTPVFPQTSCRSRRWPPWLRLSAVGFSGGRVSDHTHPSHQVCRFPPPPHFLLHLFFCHRLGWPHYPLISSSSLSFHLPSSHFLAPPLLGPPAYRLLNLTIFMPSFFHHICNVLSLSLLSSLSRIITRR